MLKKYSLFISNSSLSGCLVHSFAKSGNSVATLSARRYFYAWKKLSLQKAILVQGWTALGWGHESLPETFISISVWMFTLPIALLLLYWTSDLYSKYHLYLRLEFKIFISPEYLLGYSFIQLLNCKIVSGPIYFQYAINSKSFTVIRQIQDFPMTQQRMN